MPRGAAVIPYDGKRGRVWRIKYVDADGRQCMETIGSEREGWTRQKAEAELRERLVRVERKGWRKPAALAFSDYAETWFAEGVARRHWKPATVRAYKFVRARLIDGFGPMPLGAIKPRHISEWVSEQKHGASTISRDLAILHAIFDSAEREELIGSNPAKRIERPKMPRQRWRLLQPAEVPAVVKAFTDDRARRVFLCLILTGLRRSELEGLRWSNLDMLEGTLRVVESKSEEGERLVAIPSTLGAELADHYATSKHRADSDYVFGHPERGTRLDAKWYADQFIKALAVAGISDYIRPFHDARHAALTNLAATGASPIAVMATAGHRSMATTRRYLHLAGVAFRDDAAALERRLLGGPALDDERERAAVLDRDLVDVPPGP